MKTYKVKVVSQANSIAVIFLMLIIFFTIAEIFFPMPNQVISILLFAGLMFIAYLLWQKFVTGRLEWTIDEYEISMKWLKRFAFTNNPDMVLNWSEIKSITKGPDIHYDTLKIKLVSGEKLEFYHDTLTTKDDYTEFEKTLYKYFYDIQLRKATISKVILNSNTSQQ